MGARPWAEATVTPARALRLALGLTLVLSVAIAVARPFENEFPAYLGNAKALLDHGQHPTTAFWPTGYEAFLAGGLGLGDRTGIVILQVLAHVGLVALLYASLRLLRVGALPAALAALIAGLHPQLLVGITRISDLNLAAPLLAGVVVVALWIRRDGLSLGRGVLLGLTAGGLATVRPNLIAVLPVALFLIRRQLRVRESVAAAAAALAVVLAISTLVLGHPALISTNGPYNLAAGANRFTQLSLREFYNAEPSLLGFGYRLDAPTLKALQAESKQDELNALARDYIRSHPGGYVKLAGLKLLTAFRPDLRPRHAGARTAVESFVNILSALPIVLWLFAVVAARRLGIRTPPLTTGVVAAIIVLFVLPLVLTNSDPRFRYPLDVVLLLQAAAIGGMWWDRRARPCAG